MRTRPKLTWQTDPRYDLYLRREWAQFTLAPSRFQASLDAVRGLSIRRILDIGCGAGQELLPFVTGQEVLGIGLDSAPSAGSTGRQLFAARQIRGRVTFVRSSAERLPFGSGDIDVIVCRLALPYTSNALALREMARVLRCGGLILLKLHYARFYLSRMRQAVAASDLLRAGAAARVLVAGALYHLTGRQPKNRLVGSECFQSDRLLRRELSRCRLAIRGVMPDSNPRTPSYVLIKQ
jgi:SAM-dependent methyltransferase